MSGPNESKRRVNGSEAGRKHVDENGRRGSMRRGGTYLVVTVAIIFVLAFLLPEVLGVDVRSLLREGCAVGLLRLALGLFVLSCLGVSLLRVVRTFTLAGETWREGFSNVMRSRMLGGDALMIVLALFGGAALVVWGAFGLAGMG